MCEFDLCVRCFCFTTLGEFCNQLTRLCVETMTETLEILFYPSSFSNELNIANESETDRTGTDENNGFAHHFPQQTARIPLHSLLTMSANCVTLAAGIAHLEASKPRHSVTWFLGNPRNPCSRLDATSRDSQLCSAINGRQFPSNFAKLYS